MNRPLAYRKRHTNTYLVFEYSAAVLLTHDLAELWIFISTISAVIECITQPHFRDAVRIPMEKAMELVRLARQSYNAQQCRDGHRFYR